MTTTPAADSLTTRTIQAAQWRAVGAIVNVVSQLVVGVLLARALIPADFGLAALAYVVLGFAQLLGGLGLGDAVVQREELTDRHIRTAFTSTVVVGVAMAAATAAAAPVCAAVVGDARVASVLAVMSVGIAIRGSAVVAEALLRRRLDFKCQFLIDTGSYLGGYGGVALTLALQRYGVWSLVWGGIAQTLIASIAQFAVVRHPTRPLLASRELHDLFGFGLGSAVSGCVNYVALNGDYFVIGRWMGAVNLGLYTRAYGLMNLPHTYAARIVSLVMFPAFARVQGDAARLRHGYLLLTRFVAMVAAPGMATLGIVAPHIIRSLYGPQWAGAVAPLQILCVAGYFRAVYHLGGIVVRSVGRVYGEMWLQVIYACAIIGGALVGSRYGISGVAVAVSLAIVFMYVATGRLVLRLTGIPWGVYLSVQLGALVTASTTCGFAVAARLLLERRQESSATITFIVVAAAAIPWTVGLLWTLGEPGFEPLRVLLPSFAVSLAGKLRARQPGGWSARTAKGSVIVERRETIREIRAFSKCRNERLRLPAFLAHYRRLGVNRFFIVDNESSDGSYEYLARQEDVRVHRTAQRFSEARGGTDWMNAMLDEFGVGSWCVTADIDELLVFPGSEEASLRTFIEYCDHNGYEALSCLLLDLYPERLSACRYHSGDDLLEAAPFYDAGPYRKSPTDLCPGVVIRGGVRERVFYAGLRSRRAGARAWDALLEQLAHRSFMFRDASALRARRQRDPPCLTKVPVIRWDRESKYLSSHWITPKVLAPDTGILLHFKLLQDFHERAVTEAARGEHYEGASEYRRYAERLASDPDLELVYEGSVRFKGTSQLVGLGLMHDSAGWVATRNERRLRATQE
jgi:O-antigen/teichoic acid export membrane protein